VLTDDDIRKIAVKNAYEHDGKAEVGSVMSRILGSFPEARKDASSISKQVSLMVKEINSLGSEKIVSMVAKEYPEFMVKVVRKQEHRLPDLRNVGKSVVMRLAPSPSGPLHIGHSRMSILNDEYVKRYGGELVLRIEDTNPENIDPIAYEQIPRDLQWLGVNVSQMVIQSDRMEIYYNQARSLINSGHAYVCFCKQEEFRKLKLKSEACPHRNSTPHENMESFEKIIHGEYSKGTATLVVKTDLNHPNPSIRDWIAFRIVDAPHPRTGRRYKFYPMMNFSVAVDDHLLGLTHVIRGKDHLNNTEKQKYIFEYNNWKLPEYYHYGLINIPDTVLKTSIIKKGIVSGEYSGWDDIRLGTLMALKKRGYAPETFRRYWIESGMREIDAEFSWDIFNSMNKENVDKDAKRFFFVHNPMEIKLDNEAPMISKIPYHPGNPHTDFREYEIGSMASIFVDPTDWTALDDGKHIRLKDLCDLEKIGNNGKILSIKPGKEKLKIIHWAPQGSLKFRIFKPDGTVDDGVSEPLISSYSGVAQLERYGYANVNGETGTGYFLHK